MWRNGGDDDDHFVLHAIVPSVSYIHFFVFHSHLFAFMCVLFFVRGIFLRVLLHFIIIIIELSATRPSNGSHANIEKKITRESIASHIAFIIPNENNID